MIKEEIKEEIKTSETNFICPDYDDDCKKVNDPVKCFMGGHFITKNGIRVKLDISKGYCPMCNHCN